ncbi:MAG TPA: hypothetical protein VMX17_09010 [Candidatus Glassbacteria bacterium]|nr:hypothetical protein [Candidatus Glassbacteria bacterium]
MNSTIKSIIFNRTAFYALAAVVVLFIVGLLTYAQCNPEPLPTPQEILDESSYNKPIKFPKSIYVADEFPPERIKVMKEALIDWNKQTNGVFQMELVEGWEPPRGFDPNFYEFYDKITLWNRNVDNTEYAYLVVKHSFFSGAAKGNFIVMTDDKEFTDREIGIIFKHEVGHIAGIGHLKAEYPGLMHIGGNQGLITKFDLILFCDTYKCPPGTIE